MAWISLAVTDIENSLTASEQAGIDSPDSEADLAVIVQSVTGMVRGKVNANKRNQGHLGPAGTIPDELYAAAISISRFKYLTHLPGTQLITADRRQDYQDALTQLAEAASGDLVVVRADDPPGGTPQVGSEYGGEPFFEPYATGQPYQPYVDSRWGTGNL
jgi:hypothetical protein